MSRRCSALPGDVDKGVPVVIQSGCRLYIVEEKKIAKLRQGKAPQRVFVAARLDTEDDRNSHSRCWRPPRSCTLKSLF